MGLYIATYKYHNPECNYNTLRISNKLGVDKMTLYKEISEGLKEAIKYNDGEETGAVEVKAKAELMIERCPNPRALSIDVNTPRALDWILKEGMRYTSDRYILDFMRGREFPINGTLVVSKLYDVDDVMKHLSNPKYDKTSVITLVKDEA